MYGETFMPEHGMVLGVLFWQMRFQPFVSREIELDM